MSFAGALDGLGDGVAPPSRSTAWPARKAGPRASVEYAVSSGRRSRDGAALDRRADRETLLSTEMAAAQAGDAAAYQRLLRACVPTIAAIARHQGVRGDAVNDVVQDALMTIHRARATYDPARPFMPWLSAIAQRRAVDVLRQSGRRHAREVHDATAYDTYADLSEHPDAALDKAARASWLRKAVATLPPRQREAADRLGLAEETLEEASRRTGRSKVALKVNLHRALNTLRARLSAGKSNGE